MERKTFIYITIGFIITAFLAALLFLYFSKNKEGGVAALITKISSPFGTAGDLSFTEKESGARTEETETEEKEPRIDISQLLFKLSDERTSGIGFAEVTIPITIEKYGPIFVDATSTSSTSPAKKVRIFATSTETGVGTTTRIRFVSRAVGNVSEYNMASGTVRKVTNTVVPRVAEAYFVANGSSVILRYIGSDNKTIETYKGDIPTSTVTERLTGSFLPEDILAVATEPTIAEFFTLTKTQTGVTGDIFPTKGEERRIFESEFSEWLPTLTTKGVFLTTKASYATEGFTYLQETKKGGSFIRIVGNKQGLTSKASPDGMKLLIGEGVFLSILDIASGVTQRLDIQTLPEKCFWRYGSYQLFCAVPSLISSEQMPDDWYKGKESFSDTLYYIDPRTGTSLRLAEFSDWYKSGAAIDLVEPLVSQDQTALVFINKKNQTPWYLNIQEAFGGLDNE